MERRGEPAILIVDPGGIGARVADARKLRGLTQQGLARRVPCSPSLVSQVERGSRPPTPWFVAAVARALHVGLTDLTGQPYRGTTGHTDRAHASIPGIRAVLNYWDVPPAALVAPRAPAALRADIATIDGLVGRADYARLGAMLPGVLEELSAVRHDGADGPRAEAAALLVHGYIAVKFLAYRLGYVDLVSVAVALAGSAARESGDPELSALVAEERGQVFLATLAHDVGLAFFARARREFEPVLAGSESGLAILGSMHLRSAIMAARDRRPGETWDHLGQAREAADRVGRDTGHHGLAFGPSNVRINEVAAAADLDDADEAIRRTEGFTPPPGLPAERSSHHYIDLARAQLAAGRRDEALRSLLRADRLAPQHTRNHPMARETVTGLLRAHTRVPESLRSLAHRMGAGPTP
ncbi:MAG TPA: helix-turn-helix transcriptional regulator [Mycobacteriales bacterium]